MLIENEVAQEESIKLSYYTGVAKATLVSLNPSPEEMLKMGVINEDQCKRMIEKRAAGYSYKDENNKKYNLNFWFKLDQEGLQENVFVRLQMAVWNQEAKKSQTDKFQMMNKEYKFAWLTQKQIDNQENLYTKNKNGNDVVWFSAPYRKAFTGEENLVRLLKLVIGAKPSEPLPGKINFDQIVNSDNYSSIGNILSNGGKPNFPIKLLLGIQIAKDGKAYQSVWRTPMHRYGSDTDYKKVHEELTQYLSKASGDYYYGFGAGPFNATNFIFKPCDPTPYKNKVLERNSATQPVEGVYDEQGESELDKALSGGSNNIPGTKISKDEINGISDDDLPF